MTDWQQIVAEDAVEEAIISKKLHPDYDVDGALEFWNRLTNSRYQQALEKIRIEKQDPEFRTESDQTRPKLGQASDYPLSRVFRAEDAARAAESAGDYGSYQQAREAVQKARAELTGYKLELTDQILKAEAARIKAAHPHLTWEQALVKAAEGRPDLLALRYSDPAPPAPSAPAEVEAPAQSPIPDERRRRVYELVKREAQALVERGVVPTVEQGIERVLREQPELWQLWTGQ